MTALGRIKRMVNAVLAPLTGHVLAHESIVPSFERFARRLVAAGLKPRTVFDIGVAEGTPWLYAAFPDAKYVLVDPTRESLPHMQRWARKLDAEIWNFGLGEVSGKACIHVRENIIHSGFFQADGTRERDAYEVDIKRFDEVAKEFARPALCKIDTEGYELHILRGMGTRVAQVDVFIIETKILQPFENAPEMPDVVAFMAERGFVPVDLIGVYRRDRDDALIDLELAFAPADSLLRADRRWAG